MRTGLTIIVCIIFSLTIFLSCHVKEATAGNNNSDSLLVSLNRGPCMGRCPTYTVKFYKNGYATYDGTKWAPREGFHTAHLSKEQLSEINRELKKPEISNADTAYINKYLADYPEWNLEINIGKKIKHIKICHQSPPEFLIELGEHIDRIAASLNWIGPGNANEK